MIWPTYYRSSIQLDQRIFEIGRSVTYRIRTCSRGLTFCINCTCEELLSGSVFSADRCFESRVMTTDEKKFMAMAAKNFWEEIESSRGCRGILKGLP
jgi:hypothetical protein